MVGQLVRKDIVVTKGARVVYQDGLALIYDGTYWRNEQPPNAVMEANCNECKMPSRNRRAFCPVHNIELPQWPRGHDVCDSPLKVIYFCSPEHDTLNKFLK